MKKYFATGLVVLLPLALTFYIVSFIVNLFTQPFLNLAESLLKTLGLDGVSFLFLSPDQILRIASQILVLFCIFLVVVAIGAVGRHFFFKYLIRLGDNLLHKIPIVSSVYKTSQELIQTILTTSNRSFKQVVLVPFPTADSWAVGLVTRDDFEIDNRVSVFVPTTPNPTSGFLIMCKKEQIVPVALKVEDALRFVISCGVLTTPFRKVEDGVQALEQYAADLKNKP